MQLNARALFSRTAYGPITDYANLERMTDDCEIRQRWKRKSISSTSGEKPTPIYCRTRGSSVCILGHRHQLVPVQPKRTGFQPRQSRLDDRNDLPLRDLHPSSLLCFSRNLYDALFTLLTTICHRADSCCWSDGLFEKLKRVCRRFFLVSPSSLRGHSAIPLFCIRDV